MQFPRIQGANVCGHIIAVGEGVDKGRIGERVIIEPCIRQADGRALETPWYFGSECDGGFAQFTRFAANHAYAINSGLSDVELASFPCSYSTAENLLTRAHVKAGEHVLVTGASGGVGSAAVQLIRARGATVTAITSPAKEDNLFKLGAERVIHRGTSLTEALGPNSVDVVIDLVAGKPGQICLMFCAPAVVSPFQAPLVARLLNWIYAPFT